MTAPVTADLTLTHDDRVLLHAIAMAGDVVLVADVEYLVERWPWTSPMDAERVTELAEAGLIERADRGWFVAYRVDKAIAEELPAALDPMLRGFVGEMLCRGADSLERFQLGVRRMLAGGREEALVEVSRAWAATAAGREGPRGEQFVAALGSLRLRPQLKLRLAEAVPVLAPEPQGWVESLKDRLTVVEPPLRRAAAAAAAAFFVALELLGHAADVAAKTRN